MNRLFLFFCLFLSGSILFAGYMENKLLEAFENKNLEEVQDYLSLMVNTDCSNARGETPLIIASRKCWIEGVETLLRSFVMVNHQDKSGKTALIHAIENNSLEIVELLVKVGNANVNLQDKTGKTPLMHAVINRFYHICEFLLDYVIPNFNQQDKNGNTVAILATKIGDIKLMQKLINEGGYGINWDVCNEDGDSVLSFAIKNKDVKLVELLLENVRRIDLWSTRIEREHALLWAIKIKANAMIKTLLNYYSPEDLLVMSDREGNALEWYAKKYNCEIIKNYLNKIEW